MEKKEECGKRVRGIEDYRCALTRLECTSNVRPSTQIGAGRDACYVILLFPLSCR